MGGRETGGLSHLLPGYRNVTDRRGPRGDAPAVGAPADAPGISPAPGLAATELVEALEDGRVKAVWIVATNPVVSQPDAERFAAALRRAELVDRARTPTTRPRPARSPTSSCPPRSGRRRTGR